MTRNELPRGKWQSEANLLVATATTPTLVSLLATSSSRWPTIAKGNQFGNQQFDTQRLLVS